MNIFEETKKLNLPPGEYIVFGSGIMGALGIRDIADIDLVVSPRLFEELKKGGWQYSEEEIEGRMRKKLTHGIAETFKDLWYGGKDIDTAELIANAQIVSGIPFLSLEELVKIKRIFNRPKDHADIALIKKYLSVN